MTSAGMVNALHWMAIFSLYSFSAQVEEPAVSKDSVSVHTVRQGSMPLRWRSAGIIQSVDPPRAIVTPRDGGGKLCVIGERSSVQIKSGEVLSGRVVRVLPGENGARSRCEVGFFDVLPPGVFPGEEISGLIEIGELRDVVYFERAADSSANSAALLFVIEPDDNYARRVSVRYGQLSGSLIQVVSGLSAGERVIVTDIRSGAKAKGFA